MRKHCTSSNYRRTTICSLFALLCLVVCPGCPGPALIGLAGYFLGVLSVAFQPDNGSGQRVSDSSGAARIHFNLDGCQPRVESYEGILPGFVESGSTQVHLDLERGTITGTVTMPEGEHEDLVDVLPGLRTQRSASEMGFELIYVDGELEYKYEVQFAMQNDGCAPATDIDVEVVIRRRLTDGGEVLLDDNGSGTFQGEQQDEPSRLVPLEPPLPPLIIDAGPEQTIVRGGSVLLDASVRSASANWTATWSPSTGLSSATTLQPTASSNETTTYTLTVVDENGQRAIDVMRVVVEDIVIEPLIVSAGPDQTIEAGEAVVLQATVSGGLGNYTHQWSPVAGLNDPTLLNPSASPDETTVYTLTVTADLSSLPGGPPDLRQSASMTVVVTEPQDAIGTVRGLVTDASNGGPLTGVLVRLDRAPAAVSATTASDGSYRLYIPDVPAFFALTASHENHIPETLNVDRAQTIGTTLFIDFVLEPVRLDTIVIEFIPDVHHLGDDSFGGAINSQFQKRAEGPEYTTTFPLAAEQVPPFFTSALLTILAKGTQGDNPIQINGNFVGFLCCSQEDGSFGELIYSVPVSALRVGKNTLSILSMASGIGPAGDIDDFEFVNAQMRLGN